MTISNNVEAGEKMTQQQSDNQLDIIMAST